VMSGEKIDIQKLNPLLFDMASVKYYGQVSHWVNAGMWEKN
jgi:hypothetical protein